MATTDLLDSLFQLYVCKTSKKEKSLLETIFFVSLYRELMKCYEETDDYKKEGFMINASVIRHIINDLLVNNDYSLQGLANYTGYPEDVIYDLAAGMNLNPTIAVSAKIIELHALARRDFYNELIKKVLMKFAESV